MSKKKHVQIESDELPKIKRVDGKKVRLDIQRIIERNVYDDSDLDEELEELFYGELNEKQSRIRNR